VGRAAWPILSNRRTAAARLGARVAKLVIVDCGKSIRRKFDLDTKPPILLELFAHGMPACGSTHARLRVNNRIRCEVRYPAKRAVGLGGHPPP
jgi:hypothetical protein